MNIRAAGPEDAPLLAELNRFVHDMHVAEEPQVYRAPTADEAVGFFRGFLARDNVKALIGEADGQPVGYVVTLLQQLDNPTAGDAIFNRARRWLHVDQLAIRDDMRGRGYGRLLMEAVHELARDAGIADVELDVRRFNEGAVRFYEALGYRIERHRMGRRL